ncbi:hypothetical protein H6P81_021561 [Aristolochia fimbriata]|uniref:Uncharacterized protein n=1 Tax=Aristolochia fimbriata TaxID=158543 RepID=A0AAV7DPK4_ARIFI|nr:hypothetical protein H6P81_021561 [Aristolochia fimbriata]
MGTFFPYHYITYGNRHALVRICENRSIMKSMAMVDFFIENKGTFFPYHYITYGNRHALVRICENGSIMKSMAMIDFFNENKGKLQLKQQDIINHTRVGKGVKFLYKKEHSSHIITLPMEKRTALVRICENRSIMKSMAMVDFFIENKDTLFGRICENGSIMKSMAMVVFFIENKGTFFPYHYITYGNRDFALWSYLRKWVDNEIHGYDSTSSLKIKELSSHIITLPMKECALVHYQQKWVVNEIHDYGRLHH